MHLITSTSKYNRSFSATLDEELNGKHPYECSDEKWMLFLKDHETLLKENSTYQTIEIETMYRYRYRMREYLIKEHDYDSGMIQAFRIVNRFTSDMDFNLNITGVYLPSQSYVYNLRAIYATNKSLQSKL